MKQGVVNKIFDCLCFTLMFITIVKPLRVNFLGGPLSNKLCIYPFIIGLVYTIYCHYKYGNVFVNFSKFKKYLAAYFLVCMCATVYGLSIYPYYGEILNGPASQIEKLPRVYGFLQAHNVNIAREQLVQLWMIARFFKGLVLNIFYTFGGAYMIYCWYCHSWEEGFKIALNVTLAAVVAVCAYACLDLGYLANISVATAALEVLNPYLYDIQELHGWWPPLLWKGQVRSLFAEPSFLGIWSAFALPFVWYKLFSCTGKRKTFYFILNLFFMFVLFMAKARTATALLVGEVVLMLLYFTYLHRKEDLKRAAVLVVSVALVFVFSLEFMLIFMSVPKKDENAAASKTSGNIVVDIKGAAESYAEENVKSLAEANARSNGARFATIYAKPKKDENAAASKTSGNIVVDIKGAAESYAEENVKSLAEANARSNGARFATIYANIEIFKKHPITGVGIGLTPGYMPDNFPSYVDQNPEVQNWIKYQKEKGILRSPIGSFSEYSRMLAEIGIVGFVIFFIPVGLLTWHVLKNVKTLPFELITIFIALCGMLATGLSNGINITYCYWVLLGLGFAAIESEESQRTDNDTNNHNA
ncbi:MAG: O-antigen ligase family protein [Phascolarctobacterium sp.]|nr:O-antigen ligase family protein [Phascolarctobacterium sp.]